MESSDQLQAPAAIPLGEEPQNPLSRRLFGPHSRSGLCGEEENLPSIGYYIPTVQSIARRYTD
jgi:hypothetical protein